MFKVSSEGTPFDLTSDKSGNISFMHEGKYLHSKVFSRKLPLKKKSIWHNINQTFTLKYTGNSLYKLRYKTYCVAAVSNALRKDRCKTYDHARNQYYYVVPESFYKEHVKFKNKMFKEYNDEIGKCIEMAALRAGKSAYSKHPSEISNGCQGFQGGNINDYSMNSGHFGPDHGTNGSRFGEMDSDSSSESNDSGNDGNGCGKNEKGIEDIKKAIDLLCNKVNNKSHKKDRRSSSSTADSSYSSIRHRKEKKHLSMKRNVNSSMPGTEMVIDMDTFRNLLTSVINQKNMNASQSLDYSPNYQLGNVQMNQNSMLRSQDQSQNFQQPINSNLSCLSSPAPMLNNNMNGMTNSHNSGLDCSSQQNFQQNYGNNLATGLTDMCGFAPSPNNGFTNNNAGTYLPSSSQNAICPENNFPYGTGFQNYNGC